MSDDYAEGNDESTIALFFKRAIYSEHANNDQYYRDGNQNLVDFGFAEKRLYGRVNRTYVPVILNDRIIPLKNLASRPSKRSGFRLMAFVADAFNDLQLQFQKSVLARKIRPDEDYLSTIVPAKAYEDPQQLYYQHSTKIESVLSAHYVANNVNFRNFDEFVVNYREIIHKMAPNFPFTFPAYVKSWRCPMTITGLVVEIADLNHANDQQKIDLFVNSPNWPFYLNACRTYGFSVDRNSPWRLVADIASEPMLEYARAYGANNTEAILALGYKGAPNLFYTGFKSYLLRNYNKLKPKQYLQTEYCQSTGKTITETIVPTSYTQEDLLHNYPEEFFLELYFDIRFAEEEDALTPHEQKRIVSDALDLYRFYHTTKDYSRLDAAELVVRRFETILNKTYDYSGSLTDLTERDIIRETARVDEME